MDDDGEGMWASDWVSFIGPCTCEHEQDEHTYGRCDEDDCDCEAGWEE